MTDRGGRTTGSHQRPPGTRTSRDPKGVVWDVGSHPSPSRLWRIGGSKGWRLDREWKLDWEAPSC